MQGIVKLHRPEPGIEWGFELSGGVDHGNPVVIEKVQPNSPAAARNLKPGDRVLSIGGLSTRSMTNLMAKQAVIRCSNDLDIEIDSSSNDTSAQWAGSSQVTKRSAMDSSRPGLPTDALRSNFTAPMSFKAYTQAFSSGPSNTRTPSEEVELPGREAPSRHIPPHVDATPTMLEEPFKEVASEAEIYPTVTPTEVAEATSGEPGIAITVKSADVVPSCDVCHQKVSGSFIQIEDRCYCSEHATCAHCPRKLYEGKIGKHEGKYYCEEHYLKLVQVNCSTCGKPIVGMITKAMDRPYHPECLICSICGERIVGTFQCDDSGNIVCIEDWRKQHCSICSNCNQLITEIDRFVELLGKHYHSKCLCCTACKVPIPEGPCAIRDGKPYCNAHSKSYTNVQ